MFCEHCGTGPFCIVCGRDDRTGAEARAAQEQRRKQWLARELAQDIATTLAKKGFKAKIVTPVHN